MRRFPVARLPAPGLEAALDPGAAHHLLRVLRVERGEPVVLFDGDGHEQQARLSEVRDGVPVLVAEGAPREARPACALHLVLALPKGPAMDLAVRVATEAGATHIHPVLSRRSVARGDRGDRWARIAASAAAQCGRADVPAVDDVVPLREGLDGLPPDLDLRLAHPAGRALGPAQGPAAVLVGPEGGFEASEVELAVARGFAPMSLGRWILRADTAVAVAVALVAPRG